MEATKLKKTKKIGKELGIIMPLLGVLTIAFFLFIPENWDYNKTLFLFISLGLIGAGVLVYTYFLYKGTLPGIKNNRVWLASISSRGVLAWIATIGLTGFYVALYWYPEFLG